MALFYLHLSSQLCNTGCETKQLWDGNIHEVCILQHSRLCSMGENQAVTFFFHTLKWKQNWTSSVLCASLELYDLLLGIHCSQITVPHPTPTKKTQSNISLLDRHHGQLAPHFSSFYLLNQRPHQLFTCYRPHYELFIARGKFSAPVFLQSGRKFRDGKRVSESVREKERERERGDENEREVWGKKRRGGNEWLEASGPRRVVDSHRQHHKVTIRMLYL